MSETWQTEVTYRISMLQLNGSQRVVSWHNGVLSLPVSLSLSAVGRVSAG